MTAAHPPAHTPASSQGSPAPPAIAATRENPLAVPATGTRRGQLSPYNSPDGMPVTSGAYEQLMKDRLKLAHRFTPPWLRWASARGGSSLFARTRSALYISTVLVFGSIAIVYAANTYVVFQKEERIIRLIAERQQLRQQRTDLLAALAPPDSANSSTSASLVVAP
ncbi:hypothetical protein BC831DRAFT_473795 [Entophlyctis helioformis]|nr:hypothetical protein BC831DRAFT_473795 [Entophlyctis helioformis]